MRWLRDAAIDLRRLALGAGALVVFGLGYGRARYLHPRWLLARLGIGEAPVPLPAPVRLRLAFERLSGTYLKLGQFLAMRYDLLPREYCDELAKLFGHVPPFPVEEARKIILAELGAPPEELFSEFEREPLAAASFGQVHLATLRTGERVAVKIQRPGIRRVVESDLRVLRLLARVARALGVLGTLDPGPALAEFDAWTREELDFTREARNAQALKANAAGRAEEVYPEVYPAYTSVRVLTTEYLPGLTFEQLEERIADAGSDALRAEGLDLHAIAESLILNAARQLFVDGFYHADPHPANMLVLRGGRIGYVDFGIVGRLDRARRRVFENYVISAAQGEYDDAVDAMMSISRPGPATDLDAFYSEFRAVLRRWRQAARGGSTGERGVAWISFRVLSTFRRHGVATPTDVISFFKTLITVDSIAGRIAPAVVTADVIRDHMRASRGDRLLEALLSPVVWEERLLEQSGRVVGWAPLAASAPLEPRAPRRLQATLSRTPERRQRRTLRARIEVVPLAGLSAGMVVAEWGDRVGGAWLQWAGIAFGAACLLWTMASLRKLV